MLTLKGHGYVRGLEYSADSTILFSIGGVSTAAWAWDTQKASLHSKIPVTPLGKGRSRPPAEQLHFCLPNYILLGPRYGSPYLWEWPILPDAKPKELNLGGYGRYYRVIQSGTRVLFKTEQEFCQWNPITNEIEHRLNVQALGYNPLTLNDDFTLLSSFDNGTTTTIFSTTDLVNPLCNISTRAMPAGLMFHPNNQSVAISFGHSVQVFNLTDGKAISPDLRHSGTVRDFEFNREGTRLLSVSNDQTVRVWDTQTYQERVSYDFKIGKLNCLKIAPDGLTFAIGSYKGTIVVADLE